MRLFITDSILRLKYLKSQFLIKLVLFVSTVLLYQLSYASSDLSKILPDESLSRWLEINYYHKKGSGYQSEIINSDFFIASDGHRNPTSEFLRFKEIIKDYKKSKKHKRVLCQFPARMTFFIEHTSYLRESELPSCSDYIDNNKPSGITSISLIFASGFYKNPASYFGHLLIRLNYNDDNLVNADIDSGINYGAELPDSISPYAYIIKGVFGGFKASYQRNNSFLHSHNYTNKQLRNLWEYKLNLTPKEIKFITEHIWEMKRAKFDYYFFNDNCAHRIARVVELAIGRDLFNNHSIWAMPSQVIKGIQNDGNVLSKETYHPSLKQSFTQRYTKLMNNEQKSLNKFIKSEFNKRKEQINHLSKDALILALDYNDMEKAKLKLESENNKLNIYIQKKRKQVLTQLIKMKNEDVVIKIPNNLVSHSPLDSYGASNFKTSYIYANENNYLNASYSIIKNDFLTYTPSGQEKSRLTIGDIELKVDDEEIMLNKVTLAEITNLNTNPLPTSITKEFSWSIKADYSSKNSICNKCSNFGTEFMVGLANRLNEKAIIYSLIGSDVRNKNKDRENILGLTSETGVILDMTSNLKLYSSLSYEYDPFENYFKQLNKAEVSYNFKKNYDLRASIENDGKNSALLVGVGYYFD